MHVAFLSSFDILVVTSSSIKHILRNVLHVIKLENSQFLTNLPCFGEGSAAGISCHGSLQC